MKMKNDCMACLKGNLNRTASWRKTKMGCRFPNDLRNIDAAQTLKAIAEQVETLTDADWERLEPQFSWESERWTNAVNLTSRMVGFAKNITDLPSYIGALARVLRA